MLSDVHLVLAIGVLVLNLGAGVWGGVAWLRRDPSIVFWYLIRAAQVVVVLQVAVGLVLLAGGRSAPDPLHVVYGVAPLVISLVSEAMRVGAAQRVLDGVEGDLDALEQGQQAAIARRVVRQEMGIMSIGALLITTLALRAAVTGGLV